MVNLDCIFTGLHRKMLVLLLLIVCSAQMAWADYNGRWDQQAIADSEAPTHELDSGRYVFHIKNARQLAWFAHQYMLMSGNNEERERYRRAKLVLEGEIDLQGHYWMALGETCYSFAGEIDGNGNVIRNMWCRSDENGGQHGGLINVVEGNFKAKNIKFVDCKNIAGEYEAILVGLIQNGDELEIDNISFDNCFIDGQRSCGMIAGEIYKVKTVTMNNVTVKNSCVSPRWGGGGLVGIVNGATSLTVSNVTVSGTGQNNSTIYATRDMNSCVIGLVESCKFDISDITIDHCVMRAYSSNDNKGKQWGMLVGCFKTSSGNINNVTVNEGEIHEGGDYVGGLIGWHNASGNNQITVNNSRVHNLRIWLMGDYRYCGGLIGEAQGIWNIQNCFAEVDFVKHGGYCGGLIGKTYGSHTNVTLRNCIAHTYNQFFTDSNPHWANGGLVGGVSNNSHVDINACGVITEQYSSGNNSVGILVGGLNDGGSLSGGNCFVTNRYNGYTDESIRQVAFGDEVRKNAKFTFGKVYPYLVESNSETGEISHSAAMMNELGACLGIQSHGSDSWNRRQYLPLDDPMKGMVVRYKGGANVESLQSKHMLSKYSQYSTWVMMALGDTTTFEMKPQTGKWYINNNTTCVDHSKRLGKYRFSMVPQLAKANEERLIAFDIANLPQLSLDGEYDAIRQRSNLKWAPVYTSGQTDSKLWSGSKWEVHNNGTLLTDTLSLGNCAMTDINPKVNTDASLNLNQYEVALVNPALFLDFAQSQSSQLSYAKFDVHADDQIKLDIMIKHTSEGTAMTTEVPNSAHFDNCQVNLYRWDNETGQMIVQAIKLANPTISGDALLQAFADSIRLNHNKFGVKKFDVQKFKFDATLKDSLIKVSYVDLPENICSNYNYVFCCEDFSDSYYKQLGAIFSQEYKYTPSKDVNITSLEATKGEGKVKVTWKSQLAQPKLSVRYKLMRKLYKEADSYLSLSQDTVGWNTIYESTNNYTTNTYADDALPGYVYRYRVDAIVSCDSLFNDEFISSTASDIGYASSRGTILGSITYSSGKSRVEGVDVAVTTDTESMRDVANVSYVRSFQGKNDYLPLAPNIGTTAWDANWTLQFILYPQGNGRVVSLPGKMAMVYNDSVLMMADKKMPVTKNAYNYVMIKHVAKTKSTPAHYVMGYASVPAQNDANTSYAHYVDSISDTDMQQWMADQGETTLADELAFGASTSELSSITASTHSFAGRLDEVRLWRKLLTNKEVRNTFDRYITGSETDLMAYYTFDEGVRDRVFDTSHPSDVWNKRNAIISKYDIGVKKFLPELMLVNDQNNPEAPVLCYRGTTDKNGEYQIAGIPFAGEGTNYQVAPIFGTHEFYPTSTRRYVSNSSLVHSGVDFQDKSSFTVKVKATYSGTTLPVYGLQVMIDSTIAQNSEGPVFTDSQGKATVSVPIGSHRLQLTGQGHNLANNGYACNVTVDEKGNVIVTDSIQGKDGYYDFQKDITAAPLTFFDNTRVSLCGHVVGGDIEGNKLFGGHKTKNNIGRTTIVLKPENLDGYYISPEGKDLDFSGLSNVGISSKVIYKKESIEITTDSVTGEYYAMVPPVGYKVAHINSVNVKHGQALGDADFKLDKISTSLSFDPSNLSKDEVLVKRDSTKTIVDGKETYVYKDSTCVTSYNLKKNFVCYVDPTLEVYNPTVENTDSLMMGEKTYELSYYDKDGKEVKDAIELWNPNVHDGTTNAYNLKMPVKDDNNQTLVKGLPVFVEGNTYHLNLKLYDSYVNRENGKSTNYNLEGVKIDISNGLAAERFTVKVTDPAQTVFADTTSYEILADSVNGETKDGILKYDFTAGFPIATFPYVQKLEFRYEANGSVYTGNSIEGVVLGSVPIPGSSFISEGPNEVDFVLRDPPGSHSFSWVDAGSTIGETYTYTHSGSLSGGATWSIGTLAKVELKTIVSDPISGTAAVFEKMSSSFTDNHDHGFSLSLSGSGSKTNTVSYTLNNKLQTSNDPGYVGDDGDIYVGRTNNIILGKSRNLDFNQITAEPTEQSGIITSNNGVRYQLLNNVGLAQGTELKTTFAYTQKHIINTLIPDLRKTRRKMCIEVDNFSNTPLIGDSATYYVLKTVDDNKDQWVKDVDYKVVFNEKIDQSNKVNDINNWIKGWQTAIANNEQVKYSTYKTYGNSLTEQWTDQSANGKYAPSVEYGFLGNISLDGGTTKTSTFSRSFTDNYTETEAWTAGQSNALHGGYDAQKLIGGNHVGWVMNINPGTGGNYSRTEQKAYTQSIGYTISDANGGDYLSINTYLPKLEIKNTQTLEVKSRPAFKEFFTFRLVGGQTRCPVEGPKQSLFYQEDGKSVSLSDGSLAVEVPKMTLGTHTITDVPNGRSALVPVTFSNESEATITFVPWIPSFNVLLTTGSNPNGLQMYIDGVAVGSTSTAIPIAPGKSVTKTLEFKQTKFDVLDYDNITLWFGSACQATNFLTDSLSIHFKPASSPVTLRQTTEYVNKENVKNDINFILEDYEPEFTNFAGIRLQRKRQGVNDEFRTVANVINDSALVKELLGEIPANAIAIDRKSDTRSITIPVSMSGIADGTYLYRAVSYSKYGRDEVQTISDTLVVLRDTVGPTLLVKPTPTDGYYTIGSEIALQFNEKINTAKLTDNNFIVTASLNDALVTHRSGLHFDGNAPAKTSSRINILGNSTTVAFWYKPQVGKTSCLFSQDIISNTNNNEKIPVALFYNEDGSMTIKCGGKTMQSTKKAIENGRLIDDWMYAIITIDRAADTGHGNVILYNLFGTSNIQESQFITINNTNVTEDCNVPLYIGGSAEGDPCYADIEGFVIYDGKKEFADAAADKSNKHTANTRGLVSYWPMDEGNGLVARDKVFARNLTLQGTDNWYSPVTNYALNLNGTDQYMTIKTSGATIAKNEDYAIEMWFRTDPDSPKADMCLLSCGNGGSEVKDEMGSRKHLSLLLGKEGQIIFNASGKTYEMGKGYNDNEWHHLALNVPRDGYVSLMVDTIDIATNVSILGDSLNSVESAEMQIGAMKYNIGEDSYLGNYFKGRIDELRIWDAFKTLRNIKSNTFNRLNGNEAGLIAYYPFEYSKLVANQEQTQYTVQDRTQPDNIPGFMPAQAPTLAGVTDTLLMVKPNGPVLKAADFQSPIAVDWVDNGNDRIIISFPPELSKAQIEGCVVNFQLKNVEDMAGNEQRQPINWSLYVSQNTLRWATWNDELRCQIGESDATDIVIYNDSPETQVWTIDNVPAWLKLSQTTGAIEPFCSATITATSLESNAVGNYQTTIYIIGKDNIYEPLSLSLSVTGQKPDWQVAQTDNAIWMTIMGRLKVGNAWCTDENSLVGIFATDGRCLALASPEYNEDMSTYFVNLNIKGNASDAKKKLYARVWDAQSGLIYTHTTLNYNSATGEVTTDSITFTDRTVVGSFTKPCVISTDNQISQTITLHKGWNWISLWVTPDKGLTGNAVFGNILNDISEVKSRVITYNTPDKIKGMKLKLSNSYHVYADKQTELTLQGTMAEPDQVDMIFNKSDVAGVAAWQWIGFPIRTTMTLAEAFADLGPTTNDIIKSEDGFSMFNGKTWVGSLKYLSPGMGYVYGYNGTKGDKWHYPTTSNAIVASEGPNGFSLDVNPYSYEDYTALEITVLENASPYYTQYQLGAFTSDGLCHGVADSEEDGKCTMAIFGNADEQYTFKLFDKNTAEIIELDGFKDADYTTPLQAITLTVDYTHVLGVKSATDDGEWYNLNGIKLDKNAKVRGVIIKKNSKTIRK